MIRHRVYAIIQDVKMMLSSIDEIVLGATFVGEKVLQRSMKESDILVEIVWYLVWPRSGSEPRFEPEPGRTGPRFRVLVHQSGEPNLKKGSESRKLPEPLLNKARVRL